MRLSISRSFAVLAWIALFGLARTSQAQITGIMSSDVEGYFAATSDTFQQAEGPTIPPWGVAGPGFYPVSGVPTVPPLYPTFPQPVYPTPNIPYDAPLGHAVATPFTDGQTTASYYVIGGFNGPGTATGDAYVDIGVPGALGMTLNQPASATGYTYEQINFAMAYSVGTAGILAGLPGPRPLQVSGNVVAGGYAQFAAEVNYWWLDTLPGTTLPINTTFLGSLQYNFQISSVSDVLVKDNKVISNSGAEPWLSFKCNKRSGLECVTKLNPERVPLLSLAYEQINLLERFISFSLDDCKSGM